MDHHITNSKDLDRNLFMETKEREDASTPQFSKSSKVSLYQRSDSDERHVDPRMERSDRLRKNSSKIS